ncbi:MAG: hypothetical protein ACI9YL_001398, partial [Luteibaculaceae bacterium]
QNLNPQNLNPQYSNPNTQYSILNPPVLSLQT